LTAKLKGFLAVNTFDRDIEHLSDLSELAWFAGKDVLITGASGLMGSYFSRVIMESRAGNARVANLSLVSNTGLFPFEIGPEVNIIVGNLTNYELLEQLPQYDCVIHAAGYGQPGKFNANPFDSYFLNTSTTFHLIKKVKRGGKFLFFSSSEVYSGLTEGPFSEDMIGTTLPSHSRASYIEGKRGGEFLINIANEKFEIEAMALRLALAYGPGFKADDSRVLNHLIRQAIKNGEIRLMDQGRAWRTYCYARDAVELAIIAMIRGSERVYNLGGTSRIQIRQLANLVGRLLGVAVVVPEHENDFLPDAPNEVWLSLDKILSLAPNFDFVPLEEGVRRTIEWAVSRSLLV
jgi:UDP-glucuronate decarboxylase